MKIMKLIDKKKSEKSYMRYRINLPKEEVEKSGLIGKDLKVYFDGIGKIIIEVNDDNI